MFFLWKFNGQCTKGDLQISLTKLHHTCAECLSLLRLNQKRHSAHNPDTYYLFSLGSMMSSPTRLLLRCNAPGCTIMVMQYHPGSCWSMEPAYKGSGKCLSNYIAQVCKVLAEFFPYFSPQFDRQFCRLRAINMFECLCSLTLGNGGIQHI